MLRAFFSGETCKEGVIQERKRKGLSEDVVSGKFQPWPGPGMLWGINCTPGLSSLKQGAQAAVLLPLSACRLWTAPLQAEPLGEAALTRGSKLAREGDR